MSTVKSFRFPVSVHWQRGRLTQASAPGKAPLDVATPPEFKDGIPGVWSPEDLLVASAASCFAVTLVAIAERRELPLHGLDVKAEGHVGRRADGSFGFVVVELVASIRTSEEAAAAMERAAHKAEELCLVSLALEVPVRLQLEIAKTDTVRT